MSEERRERERTNNKALGVPANDAATCRRRAAARESRDPPKGSYIVSPLSSIGCWHIVSSRRRTMGGLLYPVAQRAGGREGGREVSGF